jgi:putative PEP-CTERM system histidine kinase
MLSVGYVIREWGGEAWGPSLQVIFFVGSLLVLTLMLSSSKARRSAKLFISQNFFKLRYDYREEWIKFSTLLSADENDKELPKRVIMSLADMTESGKGILFQWEDKRGFVLKACWNHPYPNQDIVIEAGLFTDYIQKVQKAIELSSHARLNLPSVLKDLDWGWLLVPLFHGNRLHAFVVLAHPRIAFFDLNWEVLDLLSMAGRQAAICLVQEQNAQALAVNRQFEGYNRLSAYVMHDLKNVQSQLDLINCNKEKHATNPLFIESVFQTVAHMADKIERLLVQMRGRHPIVNDEVIVVERALGKVLQLTSHRQPIPRIEWQFKGQGLIVLGDEERLVNVLCHLIENAQQATPPNGEVVVSVSMHNDKLLIAIEDTGCGMDAEFLHLSLYRPFVTTKGDQGMGIGVYEAKEYLHTIGAKLSVESVKDEGSIFKLEFPLNNHSVQQVVA